MDLNKNEPSTSFGDKDGIGSAVSGDDFKIQFYKMQKPTRGIALIFNHEKFSDKMGFEKDHRRIGTNADRDRLEKVLTSLKFSVKVHNDCTLEVFDKKIDDLSQINHKNYDCCVIVIMSHGWHGDEIACFDEWYYLKDVAEKFTALNCPTLAGKPKLFIIQACRGGKKEQSFRQSAKEEEEEGDDDDGIYTIPNHADFLIAYSTIPDHVSYRDRHGGGSYFIQSLCEVLEKIGTQFDLLTLLTKVNDRVAQICNNSQKTFDKGGKVEKAYRSPQIPSFQSMLRYQIKFD